MISIIAGKQVSEWITMGFTEESITSNDDKQTQLYKYTCNNASTLVDSMQIKNIEKNIEEIHKKIQKKQEQIMDTYIIKKYTKEQLSFVKKEMQSDNADKYESDLLELENVYKTNTELSSLEKNKQENQDTLHTLFPFYIMQKNTHYIGSNYKNNEYWKAQSASKIKKNGKEYSNPIDIYDMDETTGKIKLFTVPVQITLSQRNKFIESRVHANEVITDKNEKIYVYTLPCQLYDLMNTPFDSLFWKLGLKNNLIEFRIS